MYNVIYIYIYMYIYTMKHDGFPSFPSPWLMSKSPVLTMAIWPKASLGSQPLSLAHAAAWKAMSSCRCPRVVALV